MYRDNLPVPAAPRAPVDLRWLYRIGPPAGLTWLYRQIPPRARGWWNPLKTPNSHLALAAILGGGGWSAFFRFALPHASGGRWWWMDPDASLKDGIPFWLDG